MKIFILLLSLLSFFAVSAQTAFAADTKVEKSKEAKVAKKAHFKGRGSRAKAHFNNIDTNKDSSVSASEFNAYHTMKFKKKDQNKDGKLSAAEFSPTLAKKRAK